MAQFDVHRNPGRRKDVVPYVVVLQSNRFDRANTRFVAALVLQSVAATLEHYLAPVFVVEGREVVLNLFDLATIPVDRLAPPIASLTDEASRVKLRLALDEFTSQA